MEFCIAQKIACFEGDAQDEHKIARGFLPQKTWSEHWLAHPGFADAVADFLKQDAHGINNYMDEMNERNPFRSDALQTRRLSCHRKKSYQRIKTTRDTERPCNRPIYCLPC